MKGSSSSAIGFITSVNGASVTVRLFDWPSSLLLYDGESFRIGQIGSMYCIHVGLTQLIGICDGVQAGAARIEERVPGLDFSDHSLSLTLFGEIFQGNFSRGIGQYPTVGDEAHIVDEGRLRLVYRVGEGASLELGYLSAAPSLAVSVRMDRMVTRHSAIFGATGSGKSNFVALTLEKLTGADFPCARILILDPHDEYGHLGDCFSSSPQTGQNQLDLPYWALPIEALLEICQLSATPQNETALRDWVTGQKIAYAKANTWPVSSDRITADSPVPFSIRQMWLEFVDREVATYADAARSTKEAVTAAGNALSLTAPQYPPTAAGGKPPFAPNPRGLQKQLESLKSIILDSRYDFLFGGRFDPVCTPPAAIVKLQDLVASWVGGPSSIVAIDLSVVDAKIDGLVSGALLSIVYEFLFWGQNTKISGRAQPLLVVIDEAHRLLPQAHEGKAEGILATVVKRIAKEGRKFGVGLMIVTQRPSEVDETILSQVGTIVALRTTNTADRGKILSVVPDEFGALGSVLPALRNGEAFIVGEAVPIPTRMRTDLAKNKRKGSDPEVAKAWKGPAWPDKAEYEIAHEMWLERKL